MKEATFYKIINDNKAYDTFVGFWTIKMGVREIHLNFIGDLKDTLYSAWDDDSEEAKEFKTLDEVLDTFEIDNKPLRQQIEKIDSVICADEID